MRRRRDVHGRWRRRQSAGPSRPQQKAPGGACRGRRVRRHRDWWRQWRQRLRQEGGGLWGENAAHREGRALGREGRAHRRRPGGDVRQRRLRAQEGHVHGRRAPGDDGRRGGDRQGLRLRRPRVGRAARLGRAEGAPGRLRGEAQAHLLEQLGGHGHRGGHRDGVVRGPHDREDRGERRQHADRHGEEDRDRVRRCPGDPRHPGGRARDQQRRVLRAQGPAQEGRRGGCRLHRGGDGGHCPRPRL
mmetsp:Transcript_100783/g.285695  ORF Transcript_100783/g.285695 Transcript_100783/m.285695 type:complete len:245 (-) Transcript_100783:1355-2089(-)